MKRFYYLLSLLLGLLMYGQTPIITMIADGDCSGGTPKVIEIYANGTVDFTLYSLEKAANGGSWGSAMDLSGFGTVTDDFIYVFSDSSTDDANFTTEFPNASPSEENGVSNNNGDDGIRIVNTSSGSVIDQYGEDGVDGSGTAWEYADGYAKRNNGMGPNAVFTESEWTFANGALNNQGTCQGGTIFENVMGGIGTYMATASSEPGIAITNPTNEAILPLNTTEYEVSYVVSNFVVPDEGHIHATLDGGNQQMIFNTDPINITGLTAGEHIIRLELVDTSHNPFSPAIFSEVMVEIPEPIEVATISDLKSHVEGNGVGSYYNIAGEVVVTYVVEDVQTGSTGRNQRYVQDASGGLLLDDVDMVLSEAEGDGMTGLVVKSAVYNGVLEGLPETDPGASSTGNEITPMVMTIAEYQANPEMYESMLLQFDNMTFADGGGTFAANVNYEMSDGTNTLDMRTAFDESDIIGTTIPADPVNVVGLAAEFNGSLQLLPRTLSDIAYLEIDDVDNHENKVVLSETIISDSFIVIVEGDAKIQVFNTNGQLIKTVNGNDEVEIPTSDLQPGVYLVSVTVDNNTITKKVIKK